MRYLPIILLVLFTVSFAQNPSGIDNLDWGASPETVRNAVKAQGWQQDPLGNEFPEAQCDCLQGKLKDSGLRCKHGYYFYDGKLFQTTVTFNFNQLKNYDFNYNVFRSVNEYYYAIRNSAISFINDIYDLLQKKYGKKGRFSRDSTPD